MFGSIKKWFAAGAALVALTLPTLALADDHDADRAPRRDDAVFVQARADAGRGGIERGRHEWRRHDRDDHRRWRHDRDDRRGGDHRRR